MHKKKEEGITYLDIARSNETEARCDHKKFTMLLCFSRIWWFRGFCSLFCLFASVWCSLFGHTGKAYTTTIPNPAASPRFSHLPGDCTWSTSTYIFQRKSHSSFISQHKITHLSTYVTLRESYLCTRRSKVCRRTYVQKWKKYNTSLCHNFQSCTGRQRATRRNYTTHFVLWPLCLVFKLEYETPWRASIHQRADTSIFFQGAIMHQEKEEKN